jgi:hypothetical protein
MAERLERLGRRVTVPVRRADREYRGLRPHGVHQRRRVRGRGPVMRRHVDPSTQPFLLEEQVGDGSVGRVRGEEHGERALLEQQHERGDIDPRVFVRREHAQARIPQTQPSAFTKGTPRDVRGSGALGPGTRKGHVVQTHGLDRKPHLVSLQDGEESGAVVQVRVRERDEVDAALPGAQTRAQLREESSGVRAAVDQGQRTSALDEERVALTNVQGPHAQRRRALEAQGHQPARGQQGRRAGRQEHSSARHRELRAPEDHGTVPTARGEGADDPGREDHQPGGDGGHEDRAGWPGRYLDCGERSRGRYLDDPS